MGGVAQPSDAVTRRFLEKILSSQIFERSGRLSRFLRFVVEQTLDGHGDELKEYRLGLEVFGRDETYDPRIDPIVRVEARRLRTKLEQYYQDEGRDDDVIIDLPKGAYVPVFRARERQSEVVSSPADSQPSEAVAPAEATSPERKVPSTASQTRLGVPVGRQSRTSIGGKVAVASLIGLALAVGVYLTGVRSDRQLPPPGQMGQQRRVIAVLPLDNIGGNEQDEYFSDGITEDILTQLAKIGSLRVISRTSVMQYKETAKPTREIAQELGVDTLLEGSVRRADGRVRIVAQLIDAHTDEHLWAETYDRELDDVLRIQSEVAEAIAAALDTELSPAERRRLDSEPTASAAAYEWYLRGRHVWHRQTKAGYETALEYFQNAIEEDPGYSLGYAGLADTHAMLGYWGFADPDQTWPHAKSAALKALELDGSVAEAHVVLGLVNAVFEWDWAQADREFRQAIELNPSYAAAHQLYAQRCLMPQGRDQEALREIRVAQQLDPLSPGIDASFGSILILSRRSEEAAAHFMRALELAPNSPALHLGLARAYMQVGRFSEALATFQRRLELLGANPPVLGTGVHIHALARAGNRSEAEQLLQELRR